MGIHTGEPTVGGERYVGLGVHRAARICAAGQGGQALLSQTTRELLRDEPVPGVSAPDFGAHHLKDLDEPEHIYQLAAPGLAERSRIGDQEGDGPNIQRWTRQPSGLIRIEDPVLLSTRRRSRRALVGMRRAV
jgi:hypothetical protein